MDRLGVFAAADPKSDRLLVYFIFADFIMGTQKQCAFN